jgi:hypothetical protein
VDLKAVGYLISTLSVFLLGLVAWPSPDEPQWKALAVLVGVGASIVGMAVRFLAHARDHPAEKLP